MRLNSVNGDVPPGGWSHAAVMISAVLDNDLKLFQSAGKVPTRWENEALSSIAAAAVAELAKHTKETPGAVLQRLQQAFAVQRHA